MAFLCFNYLFICYMNLLIYYNIDVVRVCPLIYRDYNLAYCERILYFVFINI